MYPSEGLVQPRAQPVERLRDPSGHWHSECGADSEVPDGEHTALQACLRFLCDAAKLGKTCVCFIPCITMPNSDELMDLAV